VDVFPCAPQDKRTPLHAACLTGRAPVVVQLLAAKVDLDALDKVPLPLDIGLFN
jgi:hypothetical protein